MSSNPMISRPNTAPPRPGTPARLALPSRSEIGRGLSFFETMSGELCSTDDSRRWHPIAFEVKAEASSITRFMGNGRARLTGTVDAPFWAEPGATTFGTITISALIKRQISYNLRFTGRDGRAFNLLGDKRLSALAPMATATTLDTMLYDDEGHCVARGVMRFDLSKLSGFLRSWRPQASLSRVSTAPLSPSRRQPTAIRAALLDVARASIARGHAVPAPDEETVERALGLLDKAPGDIQAAYHLALRAKSPLLRYGPTRRLLSLPLKAAHFSRPEYQRAIGMPAALTGAEGPKESANLSAAAPPRRWRSQITTPEELPASETVDADVLVVGTGAGGAAVADALARQGWAVAIVEEGRYKGRRDYKGGSLARVEQLWRYNAMNTSVGASVSLPLGRAVGGTTTINSGTCLRTPDAVLNGWRSDLGLPDDFSPEAFATYQDQVEAVLQVAPASHEATGALGQLIGDGAQRMGLEHGPLTRNAPGCPGVGQCVLGCPEGAKQSTDRSFIPRALAAGAHLFVGLGVRRLLRSGRRVVAAIAEGSDRHGRPRRLEIRARRVILACGSLITPSLLADNGLTSPWLGKNLSVHPALGLAALYPQNLHPWDAIPQGYGVDAPAHTGPVRLEGYWLPPALFAPTLPFEAKTLTRWMDRFPQIGQYGFMVRDTGVGSVARGSSGRPVVRYRLTRQVRRALARGAALTAEIMLKGGATEVFTGIGEGVVHTISEARAIARMNVGQRDVALLGAHPLGTCRMAASAGQGVVDFDHRVFGTDNLHVVDGSSVPTSLGVNPQVTIMAMALRAGERIGALLATEG